MLLFFRLCFISTLAITPHAMREKAWAFWFFSPKKFIVNHIKLCIIIHCVIFKIKIIRKIDLKIKNIIFYQNHVCECVTHSHVLLNIIPQLILRSLLLQSVCRGAGSGAQYPCWERWPVLYQHSYWAQEQTC